MIYLYYIYCIIYIMLIYIYVWDVVNAYWYFIVEENARFKMTTRHTGVKRPTVPTRPADRLLNRDEYELESMTALCLYSIATNPQMYNTFNAMRFCD